MRMRECKNKVSVKREDKNTNTNTNDTKNKGVLPIRIASHLTVDDRRRRLTIDNSDSNSNIIYYVI